MSGISFIPSVAQQVLQQTQTDSIQEARMRKFEIYEKRKQIYDKMYAVDPKATVDSANWAIIKNGQGNSEERITAYLSNDRMDTLTEIDLSASGLKEVPSFVFKAKSLELLILDDNHIKKLPKALGELPNLKRIYWRRNQLDDFWWISIKKIEGLDKLDISNNSLSRMPVGIKKLTGLKELVAEENFFGEVPINRLKKATFLRTLSLSKSHDLIINENNYENLNFITVFKANKCKLERIDPSIYDMTGLDELQLQENELVSIPVGISRLSNLTKLSFYKNKLTALPKDLFDLNLKVIDLYYNELEVIPEWIGELENLEILFLAHNRIYALPESVGNLTRLDELYLHHNRLSVLPESLSNLTELKVARVNDNYLEDFPTQFLGLTELKDLDISNNQIKTIPKGLADLDYLDLFNYQDNPINFNIPANSYVPDMIYTMIEKGVICVPRVYKEEVRE